MSVVLSEEGGRVTLSQAALAQIVIRAAEAAGDVKVRRPRLPRRQLEIVVTEGRARVELDLAVRFGAVLPEVARDVQERVATALQEMCAFTVEAIDVTVEEVD